MTPQERFAKEVHDEQLSRGVRVTTKEELYPMWRVLDIALKILTFGRNRRFLTHFTTTIGRTIFFPVGWKIEEAGNADYITFRHELIHVRQFDEIGGGADIVGLIWYALLYFFLPLPIGLAWFRYRFEREAYLESMKVTRSLKMEPNIEHYVSMLSGPEYLWAWPFQNAIRGWFYERLAKP